MNQDIHIHKGRYNIGNVGKTDSMSMLTLFESRYIHKGRYNIGNVGKTASMSILTCTLFESRYIREGTTLVMLAKLLNHVHATIFESSYIVHVLDVI